MTLAEFYAITEHYPIEYFGQDWQRIIDKWGEAEKRVLERKLALQGQREKGLAR